MFRSILFSIGALLALSGCMRWEDESGGENIKDTGRGLFIVCEGNFQYGNSSLSLYNPDIRTVENNLFYRVNGMKLGDVAQSMTIHEGKGWIVVNNSHVIFAIDRYTFRELGRVEDLTSPRFIHFVNDRKAYVTQLYDNRIFIIDPRSYAVTGYIEVPGMSQGAGSTEEMVQIGKYVYCTCWSRQNKVVRIDTETDLVTGQLEVGLQPTSIVTDARGRLWTMTDGGYEGSPFGFEAPGLYCIDPASWEIINVFKFPKDHSPHSLVTDGSGETLYWIDEDVWMMDIDSVTLPKSPVVRRVGTKFYALTVDPVTSEIYVADAIDYQQNGVVYRYSQSGELLDSFYVGVNPGAFCWAESN